ncbi:MAG: Zn-dependent hydrolase [Bacteroidota bacterium]
MPFHVRPDRLARLQAELAAVGATADGGVHRPAFSDAHVAACRWFQDTAREAGLETWMDTAGNQGARLMVAGPEAPSLLLGSHLDSVPYGGAFDGALGVLCALEVLLAAREASIRLPFNLEAISFTDEEGRYLPLLGSRAFTGTLPPEAQAQLEASLSPAARAAAQALGVDPTRLDEARRAPESLVGYLEVHIEQGRELEQRGGGVGIVTEVVGIWQYEVCFRGAADHAGTTALPARRDALLGAARFMDRLATATVQADPAYRSTVGTLTVEPGALNVVPALTTLGVEVRAGSVDGLRVLEALVHEEAQAAAQAGGLEATCTLTARVDPVPLHPQMQRALAHGAKHVGVAGYAMPSGAGHDAQALAAIVPSGLLFVPSRGGRSHGPDEYTTPEDGLHGARVLAAAVESLAQADVRP